MPGIPGGGAMFIMGRGCMPMPEANKNAEVHRIVNGKG
jgi:hypothetical protein